MVATSAFAAEPDLDSLRFLQLTAFEKEKPEVQADLLEQGRIYREYREGKNRNAYYEFCQKSEKKLKPFCEFEEARQKFLFQRRLAKLSRRKHSAKTVHVQVLKKLDLSALADVSLRDTKLALSHIRNDKDLTALATKILSNNNDCRAGAAAHALALKFEERFPEKEWIDGAEKLYRMAATCLKDEDAMYSRFRAGLIGLWTRGCEGVDEWFDPITKAKDVDALQVRVRYWQHYCALKLGQQAKALIKREELKAYHPMSFHNLLVNRESPLKKSRSVKSLEIKMRSEKSEELNRFAMMIETLLQMKVPNDWIGEFVETQTEALDQVEPGFQLYIAALLERGQQGLAKFKVIGQLLYDHPDLVHESTLKMYFPLWYFDKVTQYSDAVDPFLVMGLIRQESAFNPKAQSSAGARGLMQVMPITARSFGVRQKNNLFDPSVNVRVGSQFFSRRLAQFDGDVELTLASYNAGPARVSQWIKRYPVDQRMLFLDLIPFRETRDYVTLILRNYMWYAQLYSGRELYKTTDKEAATEEKSPASVKRSTAQKHSLPAVFDLKFSTISQEETLLHR